MQSLRIGLLAVGFLFVGAGVPSAVVPRPSEAEALLEEILESSAQELDVDETTRRATAFAGLPRAVTAFLAVAAGRGPTGGDGRERKPLSASQVEALELVATRLPARAVEEHVRVGMGEAPSEAWRLAALRLLAVHVPREGLSLIVQVARLDTGVPPSLVDPLQDALTASGRSHGWSLKELNWAGLELGPDRDTLVRAVGRAGDPEGLVWLAGELEDLEHQTVVLLEMSRLAPHAPAMLAAEVAPRVRALLPSRPEGQRRHVIQALTALRDPASIPVLARVLDAPAATEGERKMAYVSLRKISGVALPSSSTAWTNWYEEEERWAGTEAPLVLERLHGEDEKDVLAAIGLLSERRLYRERIVSELAPLLADHPSGAVRRRVCLAIERLGCAAAPAELVAALEDEDLEVRAQARAALRSITGPDHPALRDG